MNLNVKKGNLFEFKKKGYYFVHCISSDCAMGAGIAVQFQKQFKLRNKLLLGDTSKGCVLVDGVFNLITKNKCWEKPTYQSLTYSIQKMLEIIGNDDSISKIAMPKIGCGLDRLQWGEVLAIIEREVLLFESKNNRELDIEVRYL